MSLDEERVSAFLSSFKRHTQGSVSSLDWWTTETVMRDMARSKRYRDLVVVPENYKMAYRMLYNVDQETLAGIIGRADVPRSGHSCAPLSGRRKVVSWTVSAAYLASERRTFTPRGWGESVYEFNKGPFLVVASTPIRHRGRRVFWFNPDLLYYAAESDYSEEQEIVSIGAVGSPCVLQWDSADGDRSWNQIARSLARSAPHTVDEFRRMCRKSRRGGERAVDSAGPTR